MNLYELFRETVRWQPEHPAVFTADGTVLSYSKLDEAIGAAAQKLQQAGVRSGTGVALHMPSGLQYIIWNYAIWRCGGYVVPIPFELARQEKHEIFQQIALDFVVSSTHQADLLTPLTRDTAVALSSDSLIAPVRWMRDPPAGFHEINTAFIRFTSGTTGASKGVVLSHESIYERIEAANEALQIRPGDRILWLLSMSYHFTVSIVSYLSFGAAIVLPKHHLASGLVEAVQRSRATLIYASPTHYELLADIPDHQPLPSLRLALSTTASLQTSTAARFHQRYGLPISQALGIIEVGLPCINLDFAAQRSEAVGRVLPAYELRMEEVGLGPHLQEIFFRGKGFLDAYYHPWRTRSEILPDGWFRTGDVGELDADGCLLLRGRVKEVISVMGMKFFPQEVETVLMTHPDVASACVFAIPHSRCGEVPHAWVTLRVGADGELTDHLRRYCAERLAGYKVPQQIKLVETLPRTASGKLLHRDMG